MVGGLVGDDPEDASEGLDDVGAHDADAAGAEQREAATDLCGGEKLAVERRSGERETV